MGKRKFSFELSGEDSCMKIWNFTIGFRDTIPFIEKIDIEYSGRGCSGHPKTIIALVTGRDHKSIDTNALKETSCSRDFSCGMALGRSIQSIITELSPV